jgi:hypothetical protein
MCLVKSQVPNYKKAKTEITKVIIRIYIYERNINKSNDNLIIV